MTPRALLPSSYLPLRALSQYSGLSVRTLRGYLHDPVAPLPHYRIGGKILVRQSDFDAWAGRFRVASSSSVGALVDDVLQRFEV